MKMAKEKTSRLGTGLSALFGEEENVLEKETAQTLPISRVEPRKDQPRREFDPAAIEELAASIREYGLIQPITVRPLDKGYYQIIAGERRWRGARRGTQGSAGADSGSGRQARNGACACGESPARGLKPDGGSRGL